MLLQQGLKDKNPMGEAHFCVGELDLNALSSFLRSMEKMASSESGIRLRQEVLQATCCYGKALLTNPRKIGSSKCRGTRP